jgi:CubicO group peptidase (beta-lactamase class C family)
VGLADGIDRYLPEFAAPGKPEVTVWHLLSQTSGVPDHDLWAVLADGAGRAELIRFAATSPLRSAPGSRYEYVSATFDLLAALIERVTGEPHPVYLRRAIFEPLRMADTVFDPWDRGDRVAWPGVTTVPGSPRPWEPGPWTEQEVRAFTDLALPGGGLFSTASDVVRFGRAMLRGGELDGSRVLPAAFVELMTREQTTGGIGASADPIRANHYALGWGKPDPRTTPGSSAAFGHGGATGTRLWIDPAHDLVFVYLSGVWGYPLRPVDVVMQAVYAALR